MELDKKNCLSCGAVVKGRSDKKFCNDYCRNSWHTRKNPIPDVVRRTNSILLKNRKILSAILFNDGKARKIEREELLIRGFRFAYNTHMVYVQSGRQYFFCYEYGWTDLNSNVYLIVKAKDRIHSEV